MEYLFNVILDQMVGFVIGAVLTFLIANWRNIWTAFKAIIMYNRDIRVSVSYLYRIKIKEKYLLIKGNRIDQFQPIGGVYKSYDSFKSIMESLEARPEDKTRFYENGDLRLILKGRKVNKFIKWFREGKNREISIYREFVEEIIDEYELPIDILKDIEIEFIKRITPRISFSKHFRTQELMIYDIFELRLSNESEKLIFDKIIVSDELELVSGDDIKSNCFEYKGLSKKIGRHTEYIL